jgi:hypothetical protein
MWNDADEFERPMVRDTQQCPLYFISSKKRAISEEKTLKPIEMQR